MPTVVEAAATDAAWTPFDRPAEMPAQAGRYRPSVEPVGVE